MGKFHRYYKNVTGSTIYVSDMNNWEIKPDAEIDLELVPEDLLSRSIHFGKLIALNKLVALPERISPAAAAPPPTFITPEIVRQIAREVGTEIAKAMIQAQGAITPAPEPVYRAPVPPEPTATKPPEPRGQMAREAMEQEIDAARIRIVTEAISDGKMEVSVAPEVAEPEETQDIAESLGKVVGKRRGPMRPGIRNK